MTRDHILFYINGQRIQLAGPLVFRRLSEFLRDERRLPGTKIVCAEGACGSCSVLKGEMQDGALRYRAVNSCLQSLFQLDGSHVVTVEGLAQGGTFSAVQDAMIAAHGAQCGYCTPGFVVALTAAQEQGVTAEDLPESLSDNLCRCTGYLPILEAGRGIKGDAYRPLAQSYPPGVMTADFGAHRNADVEIAAGGRTVFAPATLERAIQVKRAHPEAVIVSGATELAVPPSATLDDGRVLLSLGRIAELSEVRRDGDTLILGAGATWTQVETAARTHCPELAPFLRRFAAPQLRNVGTVAGSIVHGSAIADSLPPLFVLEATLELTGAGSRRLAPVREFSPSALAGGLVSRVFVPLPRLGQTLRLFKVSGRRGFDRSVVSAAFLLEAGGGRIQTLRVALSGVGPRVMRLPRTEEFLQGLPLEEDALCAAQEPLRAEIAPVSDGRGSAEYRGLLAENMLLKFFHSLDAHSLDAHGQSAHGLEGSA